MRARETLGLVLVLVSVASLLVLACVQRAVAPLPPSPPSEKDLIDESIRSGSAWLLSDQNDRFLNYMYYPDRDANSTASSILRQLAAIGTVSKIYKQTGDPRFKALRDKGFAYAEPRILKGTQVGSYYVNATDANIGEAAFMAMALMETDDFPGRDDYLRGLAQGMMGQQNPDGSFRTYFGNWTVGDRDYYPGEALLALTSLYERTGNASYLDPARKAFPYYRDYWREGKPLAFIPWQMEAYYKLYKADRDPAYRDFIYEMADYMVADQAAVYDGSSENYDSPQDSPYGSIADAVYAEGIEDAYSLAKSEGDADRTRLYAESLNISTHSIMALQYTRANLGNFSSFAIGGFRSSADRPQIRIDNVQHAISALSKHEANFYPG